jgi:hypothetical protein
MQRRGKRAIEDTLRATLREQQAMIDNPLVGCEDQGRADRPGEQAFLALVGYRQCRKQAGDAGVPGRHLRAARGAATARRAAATRSGGSRVLRHRTIPAVKLASAQTAGQSLWAVVDETGGGSPRSRSAACQAVEQTPNSIMITNVTADRVRQRRVHAHLGYARGSRGQSGTDPAPPSAVVAAMWAALKRREDWRGEFSIGASGAGRYEIVADAQAGPDHPYLAIRKTSPKKRIAAELDAHRYHLEEMVVERTAQLADAQRAPEATRAKTRSWPT